jgi:hypothetical protein
MLVTAPFLTRDEPPGQTEQASLVNKNDEKISKILGLV